MVTVSIKRDEVGLYIEAGCWIARPVVETSRNEGDRVSCHHFAGSSKVGMGKDASCGRGMYLEYWTTTGVVCYELSGLSKEEIQTKYQWYLQHAGSWHPDVLTARRRKDG